MFLKMNGTMTSDPYLALKVVDELEEESRNISHAFQTSIIRKAMVLQSQVQV